MSLDVAGAPRPPGRHPARHRRRESRSELAERLWRRPLGLAVAIFAGCGPAHALGHTDLVFHAVLAGLLLCAIAMLLGLLGLRTDRPEDPGPGAQRDDGSAEQRTDQIAPDRIG